MAAELDGPRLEPRAGGAARQLVVFLHGYGADGNDLIEIGRAWQPLLPHAAFVSPHAPEPCGQAPTGRQWFPLTMRDPNERWIGVNKAAPVLERFLDAELDAPQPAAVGAGAGRLQPGHHDGAACRACAARSRAARDRRLFRACWSCRRRPMPDKFAAEIKSRPPVLLIHGDRDDLHPGAGAVPGRRTAWRRSKCRSNGTSRPASATASTRKACATAASSWRAARQRRRIACRDLHAGWHGRTKPRRHASQSCHAAL